MLLLLLNRNLGQRGPPGGASAGAPVVSVGVTIPTTAGGGRRSARFFGAGYDYDDPIVIQVREEIKILREKKKKTRKRTEPAMYEALIERLNYLYKLLEQRKQLFLQSQDNYEYQARMEETQRQQRFEIKEKRKRRVRTIMRLLDD